MTTNSRAYMAAWRWANPDKELAYRRKHAKARKRWRDAHPGYHAQKSREWREAKKCATG